MTEDHFGGFPRVGSLTVSESRAVVAKGLIFVGAATLIGNGSAYVLSMISARILNQADFGALGAFLRRLLDLVLRHRGKSPDC